MCDENIRCAYEIAENAAETAPAWLAMARKKLGLNKADMARRLRTPYRTYQDWELGRRPIPGICCVAVELLLQRDTAFMQSIKNELMRKYSHDLPERAQKMC